MTQLIRIAIIAGLSLVLHNSIKAQELLDRDIEVTHTSGSAEQLLLHIEEQSGIILSYSNQVCLPRKVIFIKKKGTIKYFLDQIFAGCYVKYEIRSNKILIVPLKLTEIKFTIKGYVEDSISGESLIGANIYDLFSNKGEISNDYGYFSIAMNGGDVALSVSYIGYENRYKIFKLTSDTIIRFQLPPMAALKEIPVIGTATSGEIQSSRTSTIDIPVMQMNNVPSFMGETDVIKTVQLFPGVQGGNEGFSGMYVRGGGSDQNLVLLDDVPVYHMEHLMGFFSIFNPDAINKVTLIKGGFPAQYGGRLSSVLDIRSYEGNNKQIKGNIGLGLLSSKIALDGPIFNENTTFSAAFRRTYYDLISAIFDLTGNGTGNYYFYDINAKLNHRFSDRSRIYLSFYKGMDDVKSQYNFKDLTKTLLSENSNLNDLELSDKATIGWGNEVISGRWNYLVGDKIFTNLTASYSNYRFTNKIEQNIYSGEDLNTTTMEYYSGIKDFSCKFDFDYYVAEGNHFKSGISATRHMFYPGINVAQTELLSAAERDTTYGGSNMTGTELRAYLQEDIIINPLLKINGGIHVSLFETGKTYYTSLEPRLTARLLLSPKISLKAGYSSMTQYLHKLSTATISLPTDLWLPVTSSIKPMRSQQSSISCEWAIMNDFNLTSELYYKRINDLLDYKENQSFFDTNTDWSSKLTAGKSKSYGLELLLQRKFGNWSGWMGYTLSKSENQFNEINEGKAYRSNNDRRHDGKLFVSYLFNNNIDANLTWSISSGKPVTLANEKYTAQQLPTSTTTVSYLEHYNERNGFTMPTFHRLDIGCNFRKSTLLGERTWSIGVMNAYGRQNPFFLFFSETVDENTKEVTRSLKQFSLFPCPFPYIRYTLKF